MELVDEAMTIVGQTSSHRHGGGVKIMSEE